MVAKPAVPASNCPACRAGVTSQRDILPYKRPYLTDCPKHLRLWDSADALVRREETAAQKRR